jgi:hypothetical protein
MEFDIKALFSNKKDFPDDMEIALANGATISVKALREYNDQTGGALKAQMEAERKKIDADRSELQRASQEVANLYQLLQTKEAELASKQTTQVEKGKSGDLDDPFFAPVVKELNALKQSIADLKDKELKSLQQTVATATLGYTNREINREYGSLPFSEYFPDGHIPPDLAVDQLTKYALDNHLLTKERLPDLREAFDRRTRDQYKAKMEADIRKQVQDEYAKKEQEKAIASMMPRSSGLPGITDGSARPKNAPKNMAEAFSQASQDTDMWKGIATASLMPQ